MCLPFGDSLAPAPIFGSTGANYSLVVSISFRPKLSIYTARQQSINPIAPGQLGTDNGYDQWGPRSLFDHPSRVPVRAQRSNTRIDLVSKDERSQLSLPCDELACRMRRQTPSISVSPCRHASQPIAKHCSRRGPLDRDLVRGWHETCGIGA